MNDRRTFLQLRNVESAFQHIRTFTAVLVLSCAIVSCYSIYRSFQVVDKMQEKIYVLANGKALEAWASDRKDNIPVEARDHVRMFHQLFFTLAPDDKVIQTNIAKALYLADGSAKHQYDNLKENRYYANLISGNISQEIASDSILVDADIYPFYFRYHAKQKLIRATSVVTRVLVTEGYLRNVARSDNNPHGFLIEKWNTLENRNIKTESR